MKTNVITCSGHRIVMSLLILLCLISLNSAREIDRPYQVSLALLEVDHKTDIHVEGHKLEKIEFNVRIPQEGTNQVVNLSVRDNKHEELVVDGYGNLFLHVIYRNPPHEVHHSVNSVVSVSDRRTRSLPDEYQITEEFNKYLKSAPAIQSENNRIKRTAQEIAGSSICDFERVGKLAIWVNRNIEYDKNLANVSRDALWVIQAKRGTCDEFTVLFMAMARSQGIPARYVSGYGYGRGKWVRHAYSEVYLGEWIPVDPTSLQVGWIDATHIQFSVNEDNILENKVSVEGANVEGISREDEDEIGIIDYKVFEKSADYELSINSNNLRAGEEVAIILKFIPTEYAVMKIDMIPCIADSTFLDIDDIHRYIITRPGEEEIVFWRAKISSDLDNMLFICPMTLNSEHLQTGRVNVTVDARRDSADYDVGLDAEISGKVIDYGSSADVYVHVKPIENSPKTVRVGMVSESSHKEIKLDYPFNEQVTFRFTPRTLGGQRLLVYTSTGEVLELNFTVQRPAITAIGNIIVPDTLERLKEGEVAVEIENLGNTTQELKFQMISDEWSFTKRIILLDNSTIRVPFYFKETGNKKLVFRVGGEGADREIMRYVRVYDIPDVRISAVYRESDHVLDININVGGDLAKNITVVVGSRKEIISKLLGERNILINVEDVVEPSVLVSYQDVGGGTYLKEEAVEIIKMGLIEKLVREIEYFIQNIFT